MHVKLASSDSIRIKQPLLWDVYSEQGQLLFKRGAVLHDQRHIDMLIGRGAYVEHEAHGSDSHQPRTKADLSGKNSSKPDTLFELWDDIHQRLGALLRRHDGDPQFLEKLARIATDLIALVDKNIDAAIFSIMRIDMTNYAIAHTLQVATCCEIYGRFVHWEVPERTSLVNAALTMNLAMLELQLTLSKQATPPTPEQRELILSHPTRTRDRLTSVGVTDQVWLRAVAEHHETADGNGYPLNLSEVSPMAEVLNMADRYCALMGKRCERDAKAPNIAARELYLTTSGERQAVIARIIKGFGLFPPGHFVRLVNGEIAIVTHRGEHASRPRIATVITAQGTKLLDPIRRDSAKPEFAITDIVPSDECAIQADPTKLFAY